MTTTEKRQRSARLEFRTTPEDRALIAMAVEANGTDLTEFAVTSLLEASRRVLPTAPSSFLTSPLLRPGRP